MKNNNWEKEIIEKLDSYSTVDLDGLWERVESASETRRVTFIPWKKATWMAAAATAAAAILTLFLWNDRSEPAIDALRNEIVPTREMIAENNTYTIENTSDSDDVGTKKGSWRKSKVVAADETEIYSEEAIDLRPGTTHDEKEPAECETKEGPRQADRDSMNGPDYWRELENSMEKTARKRHVTFLADAGSALSAAGTSGGQFQAKSGSTQNDFTFLNGRPNLYNVFEAPAAVYSWTVAASTSIRAEMSITDRIGLSSGLAWTMLQGSDPYGVFRPSLQYIGIPVQVSCRLMERETWSVKAVCGPRMDHLVKGSPDIETGPWQLSVHGGLNAEYMFSRWLGLSGGIGTDVYFPADNGRKSPFASLTPVANMNLGLVFKL